MSESTVHGVAAAGFNAGASAYAQARPSYPTEVVDAIADAHKDGIVLDLAAGTGKFTESLLPRFAQVLASEPVAGMRREFSQLLPNVPLFASTAENIPCADSSIATVTVAQAFHWFDVEKSLRELSRVLEPGGLLAVVFNIRDDSVDWVHRLWQRLDRYDPDHVIPRHRERAWEPALRFGGLFLERGERLVVKHRHRMGLEDLLNRVASVSFIASLDEAERAVVDGIVRDVWKSDPDLLGAEAFDYPYRCELTLLTKI